MSFGDHLDELRKRILLAVAVPLPLFIVVFFFSDTLIKWLLLPVFDVLQKHGLPADLQVLSPPEFLMTELKLSLITAIVLTTPWILYQAWLFVAPGLYQRERRFIYFLLPGSFVLIVCGVALLYFVMLPLMLHVLIMFAKNIEVPSNSPPREEQVQQILDSDPTISPRTAAPQELEIGDIWLLVPEMELYIAVENEEGVISPKLVLPQNSGRIDQTFRVSFVINFTLVLMLGVAIAFQMPLVILLLGWMGLAQAPWLRSKRKYALVICGAISAVITPADAASMVIMLLPLYGLYELGILLLVMAPASAIAEGKLFGLRFASPSRRVRSANKPDPDKRSEQAGEPAQPGATDARSERASESMSDEADAGDDD